LPNLRNEPHWLSPEEVIAIDRDVVTQTGEPFLLHRAALLHSALDRPFNHWHYGSEDDVVTLAAVLLLGIVQNHPFEQGNKRTALVAALIFLELNGYRFEVDDEIYLADLIRSAAAKKVSEPDFVRIIRTFIAPK
jgi:death on curing protein